METEIAASDSYITIERMIQRGELSLSELEHVLESLLRQKNITSAEGEALLELAWGMKTNPTMSAAEGKKPPVDYRSRDRKNVTPD